MMNVMPNLTPVVAALCRMYGKQGNGGYEVFIPAEILGNLPPQGQVQQLPQDPTAPPGLRLRYLPNITIEGRVISVEVVEPEDPAPVLASSPLYSPPIEEPSPTVDEYA